MKRQKLKVGARVIVQRGSNHHAMNLRDVPGTLLQVNSNQAEVKCDYWDGPNDQNLDGTFPESKWFAKSQVRPE